MTAKPTSRRAFLSRAFRGLSIAAGAGTAVALGMNPLKRFVLLNRLERLVDHGRTPISRELAQACGKALELNPAQLVARAFGPEISDLTTESESKLQMAYQTRLAQDYREDRLVEVEGWLLAESEAALYAIVYA